MVLNQDVVSHMKHLRKLSMQLHSKMRFVSVQLEALLAKDLWLRNARHANEMAQRLADGVRAVHGVEILYPVQANAVFARLPHDVSERLQKRFRFYFWDEAAGDVRWMCSFDTDQDDVDAFRRGAQGRDGAASVSLSNWAALHKPREGAPSWASRRRTAPTICHAERFRMQLAVRRHVRQGSECRPSADCLRHWRSSRCWSAASASRRS